MNTSTMTDWNAWRAAYDEWSFDDQQAFYNQVYENLPEQARFNVQAFERLLFYIDSTMTVVELGGWDGGFAHEILLTHREIGRWTNYEISPAAVQASICRDLRYIPESLEDWYWADHHVCDLFVASHVLEHLSFRDVRRVFDATEAKWLYLQSPLEEVATNWHGYHGSHILEVGWSGITAELDKRGFLCLEALSRPHVRCFEAR